MEDTMPQMQQMTVRQRDRGTWLLAGLLAAAILVMVLAVCQGTVRIVPAEVCRIIMHKLLYWGDGSAIVPAHADIIWQIRLPRVLMAAIAGAGLAMCGTVMQAAVQNPLADPYLLGISAGASLGAVFSILIGASGAFAGLGIAFWAFIGAVSAAIFVMLLAQAGGRATTVKMVLAGMVANALFGACANFIIYFANNAEGIRTVTFWTMGSLAGAKWSNITIPAIVLAVCVLFFLTQWRVMNALLLGEEAAVTLGIDTGKVRRHYMLITAFLTGLLVASCGVIGFVGLIIPHIVRGIAGADHRRLLPVAVVAGALFLTFADLLARTLLPSGEVPVGIITALIGGPVFIYILIKKSDGYQSN